MAAIEEGWSHAFLVQARSDLETYEKLTALPIPVCHRLHYLQMWLEKLCKAYLWSAVNTRNDLPDFRRDHQVIAKFLPALVREHWRVIGYASPPDFRLIRDISRECDLLHPQIDQNGERPENVEYPWSTLRDARLLIVPPASERFRLVERINHGAGLKMMKAAAVLTRNPRLWSPEVGD